jgi:NADPH:quinone reductase-like Zn-dependent oxidoreductase
MMKAIVYTEYGPPDVLQLKEVERPVPKDNEVLIKVHAASINHGDSSMVRGSPFVVRLSPGGLRAPNFQIPGGDVAGTVEAVGKDAGLFQPGDAVFGDLGESGFGALAEYVAAPEDALVRKPDSISFEDAAAVCQAPIVALQGLRDKGEVQAGHKVLVNGASGGVGTFAVQIAKAFGAEVTGVCSTENLDLVRSIGADHVIDYTREDFTQRDERYDLIFDNVANRSVSDYLRALKPGGTHISCAFSGSVLLLGPLRSALSGKKVVQLTHSPKVEDLAFMSELMEAGKVVPVIDRRFPLEETAKAYRHRDAGVRGKVVITVTGGSGT